MTPAALKAEIATDLTAPVNQVIKVINSFNKVIDFVSTEVASSMPLWAPGLTFQTDGSDDGQYCKHPDSGGNLRLFETKTDDNTGNAPPTDPGTTENTWWIEVSPSASAPIPEWSAGVYGPGLVIVFHNHSVDGRNLYQLINPIRPFTSSNIETEITGVDWALIGASAASGGGPAIDEVYANIAALLADQSNQEENAYYWVTDASTDGTVDSGWAIYRKLSASTGALGDYVKVQEQESLDIVATPDASETVAGKVEEATDAEVTAGTATGGTGAKLFVSPAKLATRLAFKKDIANISPTTVTTSGSLTINSVSGSLLTLDCANKEESKFKFVGDTTPLSIALDNFPEGAYCILTIERTTNTNQSIRFKNKTYLLSNTQLIDNGKDALISRGRASGRTVCLLGFYSAGEVGAEDNQSSPVVTNLVNQLKFVEDTEL